MIRWWLAIVTIASVAANTIAIALGAQTYTWEIIAGNWSAVAWALVSVMSARGRRTF